MIRLWFAAAALLCMACEGCIETRTTRMVMNETRDVTLPDGATIKAEVEVKPEDMARGMMYRDSLPSNDGMLFVHPQTGEYPYWMANCKFPLDIIWMDSAHKVVEVSAKTPPCPKGGSDCATYGGHAPAQYVLELNGGQAAVHSVNIGTTIRF